MNIVFMGTPEFAIPSLHELAKNFNVKLVITQPDKPQGRGRKIIPSPIKKYAMQKNIEVYQPENINSKESIEKLREVGADYHIVVAYGQIVSREVLNLPKVETLNVHASLLPEYRGGAPIHRAIIDGKEKTGVTIMIVKPKLDSGPILLQEEVQIEDYMTTGILHDILADKGAKLLIKVLNDFKKIVPIEQDNEKYTYADLINADDRLIDWCKSNRVIFNKIRGLNPWPEAYTFFKNKRLIIVKAELVSDNSNNPGEITEINDKGIVVSTNQGGILLKEVKPQGKKKMSALDFVRGYEVKKGDILN